MRRWCVISPRRRPQRSLPRKVISGACTWTGRVIPSPRRKRSRTAATWCISSICAFSIRSASHGRLAQWSNSIRNCMCSASAWACGGRPNRATSPVLVAGVLGYGLTRAEKGGLYPRTPQLDSGRAAAHNFRFEVIMLLAYIFLLLAIAFRFAPHPMAFTPIAASLLFFGARVRRKHFWVPLLLLGLADLALTRLVYSYPYMADQFISLAWYAAALWIGTKLTQNARPGRVFAAAL